MAPSPRAEEAARRTSVTPYSPSPDQEVAPITRLGSILFAIVFEGDLMDDCNLWRVEGSCRIAAAIDDCDFKR